MSVVSAQAQKAGLDLQTPADPGVATAKQCRATTRSGPNAGKQCRAHPLAGSDLCAYHTPGLATERGRRGGLNRRKPAPPPKVLPEAASAPASAPMPALVHEGGSDAPAPPADPMDAQQVRIFLEKIARLVVAGRLNPNLAKAAVATAGPWLRAIAQAEKTQDVERRLAALEKAQAPK
jgi:hypothetical protein